MNELQILKEFIIEQINDYKEQFEEVKTWIQECREDLEYQEDILEDIEEMNLYEGIGEGLAIALQKIKELENKS